MDTFCAPPPLPVVVVPPELDPQAEAVMRSAASATTRIGCGMETSC
jgi:hypothetical protein